MTPRVAVVTLVLAVSCAAGTGLAATPPSGQGSTEKPATDTPPAGAPAPAAPGGAGGVPVDNVAARMKAVGDAVAEPVKAIGWAIVTLVLSLIFRQQVVKILKTLVTVMKDRGVTLDVGVVKVQVAERVLDASDDRMVLFSDSPFEIGEDPALDRPSVLGEIPPQRKFPVTDTVARYWKTTHPAETERLTAARKALEKACRLAHDFARVRPQLVELARALEASRFLEAAPLVDLLERDPDIRQGIHGLQPRDLPNDLEDYLILHAAGVAYSQRCRWKSAKELLDKIVWKDKDPRYLPAVDTWLACAYHAALGELQTAGADRGFEELVPKLAEVVEKLLGQGQQVADTMAAAEAWGALPSSAHNVGFYQREVQKSIGQIASILWDYSDPKDKPRYRAVTERALTRCCDTIGGEDPSALDWNNRADVYRQQGEYAEAHRTLDRAGAESDPTFDNTRALIFLAEKKPLQGLLALQRYGEAQASAAEDQDLGQYVENQILAAKLAAAVEPKLSPPYLALAAGLLEGVRQFVDASDGRRRAVEDQLRAEIDELLGFTYLQLSGRETEAVEAFARLQARGYGGDDAVKWRRRLGHARALTRLARSQRRNFSVESGEQYRKRAAEVLADSGEVVKRFGLATAVPLPARDRHLRLHLDTVIAVQGLAEETFSQGAWQAARDLANQGGTILDGLEASLRNDVAFEASLGDRKVTIFETTRFYRARRGFLLGRILIHADPGLRDPVLIASVEKNFASARGVGGDLECGIDLELGQLLLAAAFAGIGDAEDLYRRAVRSLELATTRDAPQLRPEALRALADAYARRAAVRRRAKKVKEPKASG